MRISKFILIALAPLAGIAAPPGVAAADCNWITCQSTPWDGQMLNTWNTPGYYGGWTTNPVACDPFTTNCIGYAAPTYEDSDFDS